MKNFSLDEDTAYSIKVLLGLGKKDDLLSFKLKGDKDVFSIDKVKGDFHLNVDDFNGGDEKGKVTIKYEDSDGDKNKITFKFTAENTDGSEDGPITYNGDNGPNTIMLTGKPEIINGFGGNDKLYGFGGDDVINGGDGDDFISGGKGVDVLTGGAGVDIFYIEAGDGIDTVTDFDPYVDFIEDQTYQYGYNTLNSIAQQDDTGTLFLFAEDKGLFCEGLDWAAYFADVTS